MILSGKFQKELRLILIIFSLIRTHTGRIQNVWDIFPGNFTASIKRLKTFFFFSKLISVEPETRGEDKVISEAILREKIQPNETEALIIRTLPNFREKQTKKYSHTNWPYLSEEAAIFLRNSGVKHLLIDLPSVDKEKDGGKLLAHKAFWNYPKNTRFDATITELVYVPNSIEDGDYLLNLQIASFENDASPSKPVLYKFL